MRPPKPLIDEAALQARIERDDVLPRHYARLKKHGEKEAERVAKVKADIAEKLLLIRELKLEKGKLSHRIAWQTSLLKALRRRSLPRRNHCLLMKIVSRKAFLRREEERKVALRASKEAIMAFRKKVKLGIDGVSQVEKATLPVVASPSTATAAPNETD